MTRMGPVSGWAFDDVLDAAASGDSRAFDFLFELLHRRVYAFAQVRGAWDPEGLVNEVFLQAFTNLTTFQGTQSQFKAWVFRIARNRLIDDHRRMQRRPHEERLEEPIVARLTVVEPAEEAALGRMGSQALLALVDRLTTAQRDVVLLRIVADLTIDAVADILDKPPGAVKALQRRAFRALAREISAATRTDFAPCDVSGG